MFSSSVCVLSTAEQSISLAVTPTIAEVDGGDSTGGECLLLIIFYNFFLFKNILKYFFFILTGDKKENYSGYDFVNTGGNMHSIREEGKVSISNKDNKETPR